MVVEEKDNLHNSIPAPAEKMTKLHDMSEKKTLTKVSSMMLTLLLLLNKLVQFVNTIHSWNINLFDDFEEHILDQFPILGISCLMQALHISMDCNILKFRWI